MNLRDMHLLAFPSGDSQTDGMTLRDYFAAKAMAALIIGMSKEPDDSEDSISWALSCGVGETLSNMTVNGEPVTWAGNLADNAYGIAEAMLAERSK